MLIQKGGFPYLAGEQEDVGQFDLAFGLLCKRDPAHIQGTVQQSGGFVGLCQVKGLDVSQVADDRKIIRVSRVEIQFVRELLFQPLEQLPRRSRLRNGFKVAGVDRFTPGEGIVWSPGTLGFQVLIAFDGHIELAVRKCQVGQRHQLVPIFLETPVKCLPLDDRQVEIFLLDRVPPEQFGIVGVIGILL